MIYRIFKGLLAAILFSTLQYSVVLAQASEPSQTIPKFPNTLECLLAVDDIETNYRYQLQNACFSIAIEMCNFDPTNNDCMKHNLAVQRKFVEIALTALPERIEVIDFRTKRYTNYIKSAKTALNMQKDCSEDILLNAFSIAYVNTAKANISCKSAVFHNAIVGLLYAANLAEVDLSKIVQD